MFSGEPESTQHIYGLACRGRFPQRTKRRADWDSFHKLSMDALNGIAYEDDRQIRKAAVALAYDKQKPRIELWCLDACRAQYTRCRNEDLP